MKACRLCGIAKALTEFHKMYRTPDGLNTACKKCVNQRERDRLANNPDYRASRRKATKKMQQHYKAMNALKEELGIFEKQCSKCKQVLPVEQFMRCATEKDNCSTYCKPCIREADIGRKYRLTIEQHREMFETQQGCCAICQEPQDRSLAVDHDHTTGAIRGLLCSQCNLLIGNAKDDVDILRSAIAYLQRHHSDKA